jgi:beta-glucosidase
MCSYNKINGTLACENSPVLNDLLKQELNFPGWVITDWTAAHTTVGAATGGSDYVEVRRVPICSLALLF